jgi:hypothetical protein
MADIKSGRPGREKEIPVDSEPGWFSLPAPTMSEQSKDPNRWYFPTDLVLALFPVVAAMGLLVVLPIVNSLRTGELTVPLVGCVFALGGVVLLFFARLPLYRQRRFLAFGSKLLDEPHRRLYRWAYRFICLGVLLLLLTLLAVG